MQNEVLSKLALRVASLFDECNTDGFDEFAYTTKEEVKEDNDTYCRTLNAPAYRLRCKKVFSGKRPYTYNSLVNTNVYKNNKEKFSIEPFEKAEIYNTKYRLYIDVCESEHKDNGVVLSISAMPSCIDMKNTEDKLMQHSLYELSEKFGNSMSIGIRIADDNITDDQLKRIVEFFNTSNKEEEFNKTEADKNIFEIEFTGGLAFRKGCN